MNLDVHVLTLPGLPQAWIDQRRDSLEVAVAMAGFPVTVREVEGIDGHLGQSRLRAYSGACADYVTHVDHDDYVRPDAFAVLASAMRGGAECITTGETIVRGERMDEVPESRHHLAVYRFDRLLSSGYSAFRFYPDQYLLSLHSPVHVAECVYFHRIFQDSASRRQRLHHHDDAMREFRVIGNAQLCATEHMTPAEIAALTDMEVSRG